MAASIQACTQMRTGSFGSPDCQVSRMPHAAEPIAWTLCPSASRASDENSAKSTRQGRRKGNISGEQILYKSLNVPLNYSVSFGIGLDFKPLRKIEP